MEHLKEIISIVDKNKTKHIEIIGSGISKDSKLNQLYEGILYGKFNSDVQACKHLFGTNELEKGYRNLKSRLEKRVLNTLFFIDTNAATYKEKEIAYYNCYKNLAAVKFLYGRGGVKAGLNLSEKTLKTTLKFDFHEISIPLLKDLRTYYGTLVGDKKKYKKYNTILKRLQQDTIYEERAREMYDSLASQYAHSKTVKPAHLKLAREYAKELESYLDKTTYRTFHFYAHVVIVMKCEIENDFPKTIEVCNRALNFLENMEHTTKTQRFFFLFKRMISRIKTRKLDDANSDAQKCLNLIQEGSLNWFVISQFYILLLFHSE